MEVALAACLLLLLPLTLCARTLLACAQGIRLHELHRLRRAGQIVRTAWRRAQGSLLVAEPGLKRMSTSEQVAAAVSTTSPSLDPRKFSVAEPGSGGSDGSDYGGRYQASPPSHRGGLLLSGRALAHAVALSPTVGRAAVAVDMIDAAISARPLEEAAMLQHLVDSAELQRRTDDCNALEVELRLTKAEATEVAEENLWVREALDESRERLSAMAEELAATRAALYRREQQLEEARHGRKGKKSSRGAGTWPLGCVGGRDEAPSTKTYSVPILAKQPPPPPPPQSFVVSVTPRHAEGVPPSASSPQEVAVRMRGPAADAGPTAMLAVSYRRVEPTGEAANANHEPACHKPHHQRASRRATRSTRSDALRAGARPAIGPRA